MSRTVTIIGVTGLIGSKLWQTLKKDDHYTTIRLLVRRPFHHNDLKTEVKLVDFSDTESFKLGIEGSDAVFCAIGTTMIKVKGDIKAYRKIDFDIILNAARFSKETGCENFLFVSSVGANKASTNFYLKLKGEIEEAVKNTELISVSAFRPSMLLGVRHEKRFAESIPKQLMQIFSFLFIGGLKKYKAINAEDVAHAMVWASKRAAPGFKIYEYEEMMMVNLPGEKIEHDFHVQLFLQPNYFTKHYFTEYQVPFSVPFFVKCLLRTSISRFFFTVFLFADVIATTSLMVILPLAFVNSKIFNDNGLS